MSPSTPQFKLNLLTRAVCIACGATVSMATWQPVFAQEASEALQRVEVTGSAIKRVDAETAIPVTVLKMAELKKSGVSTVEQALAAVSASQSSLGTSQIVGSGTGGAAYADLRGLGSNKTLILLNGRRVANNSISGSSPDLNMIPFAAIDRIEVLRDGASALYGSDAIGGVINFITRNDYAGGTITVGVDRPQREGGEGRGVNVGVGFGDLENDGFNIFGFVDVQNQANIGGLQRSINKRYPGGLSVNPSPGNYGQTEFMTGNWMNPAAPACNANPNITPDTDFATACKESTSGFVDYTPKSERTSGFLKGTVKLGDSTQAGLEYFFSQSVVQSKIAPVPYFGKPMNRFLPDGVTPNPFFPGNAGAIAYNSTNNPYNPAFLGLYGEVVGLNDPGNLVPGKTTAVQPGFVYVNWRDLVNGERMDKSTNTQQRFVASLDGTAADWDYQAAATYNENTVKVELSGYGDGALISEGIVAGIINPFGAQSAAGQSFLKAAALGGSQQKAKATSVGVDGHASRALGDWTGAGRSVSVAVGGSYSKDSMYQVGDDYAANVALKASTGFDPATNNRGERNVKALFSEFNIPFSKELEVTVAGRADMYSDMGNSVNPKVGFRYQPSQQMLFRGSASTGFRAPSLYDAYSSNVFTNTSNVQDRVTGKKSQFIAQYGGNPDLKPETSKTLSLGFVAEPTKGLSFTADVWSIQMEHVIGSLPDTTAFGSDQFNALFHRNAAGGLSQSGTACPGPSCGYVDLRTQNLGGINTNGVDLSANYRLLAADAGLFTFGISSTYVNKYEYQDYENGPWNQNVGAFVGAAPIFQWTHNAIVNWSNGVLSAGLGGHYKSGYTDQNTSSNRVKGGPVDAYVTFDAYGSWAPTKSLSVTLGVRNLTDVEPPLSYQVQVFQAGYDPRYTDPTGRAYYLRGTYTF